MRVFLKCWERLLVKKLFVKKKKSLSILQQLRIKQIYGEDFIFKKSFDVLTITVSI